MKPALVTIVLSAGAVLGYLTYRLALDPGTPQVPPPEAGAERELPDTLPEFTLPDLEGVERALSSFAGEPLVINYWATWCAPCLREIPRLKDYQSAHDNVRVLGVAVDYAEPVREFAAEMGFNYPVLIGQSEAMTAASAFGVNVFALPFTVFTSASGAVIGVHTGEVHAEHLEAFTAVLADLEAGAIDVGTARRRMARVM